MRTAESKLSSLARAIDQLSDELPDASQVPSKEVVDNLAAVAVELKKLLKANIHRPIAAEIEQQRDRVRALFGILTNAEDMPTQPTAEESAGSRPETLGDRISAEARSGWTGEHGEGPPVYTFDTIPNSYFNGRDIRVTNASGDTILVNRKDDMWAVSVKDRLPNDQLPSDIRTALEILPAGVSDALYRSARDSFWADAEHMAQTYGFEGVCRAGHSGGWMAVDGTQQWDVDRIFAPSLEFLALAFAAQDAIEAARQDFYSQVHEAMAELQIDGEVPARLTADPIMEQVFQIIEARGDINREQLDGWLDANDDNDPIALYEQHVAPAVNEIEDAILRVEPDYMAAIRTAAALFDPDEVDASPEYLRGACNVLAELYPIPHMAVGARMEQIEAAIRAQGGGRPRLDYIVLIDDPEQGKHWIGPYSQAEAERQADAAQDAGLSAEVIPQSAD